MLGDPMRLRRRRSIYSARRSTRWRLPLTGGIFVFLIGAACWAPLAPAVLAPAATGEVLVTQPVPTSSIATLANATSVAPTLVPAAVLTPTPTLPPVPPSPTPVVIPTLSANGAGVLAAIKADRHAQWVKNHTETALLSGPNDTAVRFTTLPQWTTLKQLESRPDWMLVQYSGDGDTRQPGPGWVRAADVGAIDPPTVWLTSARTGSVWSAADGSAKALVNVPPAELMEVIGPDDIVGGRVHVRLPGDGRTVPPTQGWVDGDVLARAASPASTDLPWAYPASLHADVRISVPYRTQLDGSDYAGANCGPTVLGMALEAFGMNLSQDDVRGQVLSSENFEPNDNDAGTYIWALALVAREHGLQTRGLYDDGSDTLHQWSLDEIRASVRQNRPVIVQVVYRALPGRQDSEYYGDHYIIVTGLIGSNFLYNDPIGGASAHESPGYDRLMGPLELEQAMRASDTGYQYTAFSVSRS
jgi:hypothetical protein